MILRKKALRLLTLLTPLCFGLLLTSCSYTKPQTGTPPIYKIKQTLQNGIANNNALSKQPTVPAYVNAALIPNTVTLSPASPTDQRFDIDVNNMPAKTFFTGLVKQTGINIIIGQDVSGSITLSLKQVTLAQILDAVHDIYGYQYQKTPYGYQILPNQLETKFFSVNYLYMKRTGTSDTTVDSSDLNQNQNQTNGTSQTTTSNSNNNNNANNQDYSIPTSEVDTQTQSDFWGSLKASLQEIIGTGTGKQIILNPEEGVVIVRAYPNELEEVSKYLSSVSNSMDRQVIIDAKILEITLASGYQAGIDWQILGVKQEGNADNLTFPEDRSLSRDLKTFSNIFTVNASNENLGFSSLIKLLSLEGNVQVLSSPRIATVNNQKAVIKVGKDEYFITNISNTITPTTTNPENTQNVNFTPFFSGIALDVTPQISASGKIILHIHPIISNVRDDTKKFVINGQDQSVPLAATDVRESDSIISADNGQLVVIGGLMDTRTVEADASTPYLDKTAAGPLFRRTDQQSEKVELVILLRPIIVNNDSNNKLLKESAEEAAQLNKGYYMGSHPETFGNLGEPLVKSQLED